MRRLERRCFKVVYIRIGFWSVSTWSFQMWINDVKLKYKTPSLQFVFLQIKNTSTSLQYSHTFSMFWDSIYTILSACSETGISGNNPPIQPTPHKSGHNNYIRRELHYSNSLWIYGLFAMIPSNFFYECCAKPTYKLHFW
jgi:hypothetical protein